MTDSVNYASIFLYPFIDAFAAAFDGASAISVVDASVFPVRFGTFCHQVLSQFSIQMARSLKGYQSHLRLIWDRTHLRQTDIPVQGFDIFGGVLGAELRRWPVCLYSRTLNHLSGSGGSFHIYSLFCMFQMICLFGAVAQGNSIDGVVSV